MKTTILAALMALGLAGPAFAQGLDIGDQTPVFCRDDRGDYRLMTYFSLGDIRRRYEQRFNFVMTVQRQPLQIAFSAPGVPYSITYEAQPYTDDVGRKGVVLLSMHMFLENADRDVTGSPMCYFTQFGK